MISLKQPGLICTVERQLALHPEEGSSLLGWIRMTKHRKTPTPTRMRRSRKLLRRRKTQGSLAEQDESANVVVYFALGRGQCLSGTWTLIPVCVLDQVCGRKTPWPNSTCPQVSGMYVLCFFFQLIHVTNQKTYHQRSPVSSFQVATCATQQVTQNCDAMPRRRC